MLEPNNIKRNTNDFSFTETVASLANNKEYKSGYVDLLNGKNNDKTYFWTCLSAVGEEVSEVIYENVLNYINNVANINTCKLVALTSIAKVLGITEFAVLKNLKTIPEDVLKIMDIFSINRANLLNIRYFNTEFVSDLLSATLNEDTLLSLEEHLQNIADAENEDELSSFSLLGSISNEKYKNYVEEVFFKVLTSKLFQSYGNDKGDLVYENLLELGNLSVTNDLAYMRNSYDGDVSYNMYQLDSNGRIASSKSNYAQRLYRLKRSLNVAPGFNEHDIVDNIENGLDFLDNYQGGQLSVLQLEIDERAKTKFSGQNGYAANRPNTRYSYYNEVEVKKYVKFVDDMFLLNSTDAISVKELSALSASYVDWTPYVLKNNFHPYFLNSNYSEISFNGEDIISLEKNINDQFESYKKILLNDSIQFSSFVYDYYSKIITEKDIEIESNEYYQAINANLSAFNYNLPEYPEYATSIFGWMAGLHRTLLDFYRISESSFSKSEIDSFYPYVDGSTSISENYQIIGWIRALHRFERKILETAFPDKTTAISNIDAYAPYLLDPLPNSFNLLIVVQWILSLCNALKSVVVNRDERLYWLSKGNVVRIVARILRDICFAIVDIREKMKTQSQRNYMTGTKLLIEYILDEYLAHALIHTYGVNSDIALDQNKFGAKIVEYIDTTEYFNIGLLDNEQLRNNMGINAPFFNNLSGGGQNATQTGVGLAAADIRNFYMRSLNLNNVYLSSDEDYFDFMSAVYEIGISKTYSDGANGTIAFSMDELSDNLQLDLDYSKISVENSFTSADLNFFENNWYSKTPEGYILINYDYLNDYWNSISSEIDKVSSDIQKYNDSLSIRIEQQNSIILTYRGTDIDYYPWYNYKNQNFPTFQSHPYLYNFVEHGDDSYPIDNAFYGNANEDLIYELQSKNISVYLGDYGNIKRIWRNSNLEYSGYKSRYENSLHSYGSSNSSGLYSVTHYDGIFYPPAVSLYKRYASLENPLTDVISGVTYSGLELLSVHMMNCVDSGDYYRPNDNLDISQISSMWHYYSHLNLNRIERQFIVDQLINLSADILEMSDFKYREESTSEYSNVAEPYDVYKYGLDYNKNSIILLKRYFDGNNILKNDNVPQSIKRNTVGQIWIKLNSHPIGFPAFLNGSLSSMSQVYLDTSGKRDTWNSFVVKNVFDTDTEISRFGTKHSVNNIYDFDLTENGSYLVFAIKNPSSNVIEKKYSNSVAIASRIVQRRTTNYFDPTAERTIYQLVQSGAEYLYPTNDQVLSSGLNTLKLLSKSDYEFDGFFQAGSKIFLGYFKRNANNSKLQSISLNAISYPGTAIQSTNVESGTFYFDNSFEVSALNNVFAETNADAKIRLGYNANGSNGTFTAAIASKVKDNEDLFIQDFIGYNNFNNVSGGTLSNGFGFTNYIEATSGVWQNSDYSKNITSFDRFTDLISLYDIPVKSIRDANNASMNSMIYALNSDASYVPLYCGLNGQNIYCNLKDSVGNIHSYNEQWHRSDDSVSSDYVPRQSMELLGYSYQKFDNLVNDKEETLYKDKDTGKYAGIDTENLLGTTVRVYEDYLSSGFVYQEYNRGFVWNATDDSNEKEIAFIIDIPSLTPETSSTFNILLLNTGSGKDRNPIIAGSFSYETLSSIYYDKDPTYEEDYMLSTGFKPDNKARIVGTPNPFDTYDSSFMLEYSNHIFNISGLVPKLEYDSTTKKFIVKIKLQRRDSTRTFAVQSEQLLLFIYSNRLDQFEKYHYLEPTGMFPFNAAISSWNMPWKEKNHAWLYVNGFELSDSWKDKNNYLDKRSVSMLSSYKEAISKYGTLVSANIGHLPISDYENGVLINPNDSRLHELSLMENINLSELSSFNDNYYLSTGQLTWKISEEDKYDYLKLLYPPTLIDMLLYEKFESANKEHVSNNIFELSNTYIFQLEDPISVANKIGTIAIPIGNASDEFTLVYEDFLSDHISVDVGGDNFLRYCQMIYDPTNVSGISDIELTDKNIDIENELCAINSAIADKDMSEALEICNLSGYYQEESEKNESDAIIDYFLLSATPEEISNYLKIYVNWKKYKNGDNDEIELFFNYPNLFLSPYSYKTKNGYFTTEYKPNTYLKLKSGQDGFLYIVFQFKFYDSAGILCGVRDLPIITYRIFNVSDDKPKFVITKTYEIDNRNGKYTYPGNNGDNIAYIIVNSKRYKYNTLIPNSTSQLLTLDQLIDYDYTFSQDLYLSTTMEIVSPIPLSTLSLQMTYDRGRMPGSMLENDPEFVLEPTLSKPYLFEDINGMVSVNVDLNYSASTLEFTLFRGASISEETLQRVFPIEVLNATGKDINGNTPKFVFINGYISLDDSMTDTLPGAFLARELNFSQTSSYNGTTLMPISDNDVGNAGWILEEQQRALIRMYSLGRSGIQKLLAKLSADSDSSNDIEIPLKTTGTRQTRFDATNDTFLIT